MPHWVGMLQIFQLSVWSISLSLIVFICLVIWLSSKLLHNENRAFTTFPNIIFNILPGVFGVVPNVMPRSRLIRFIVLLWILFGLNWTSAYTSSLMTMISIPLRPQNKVWQLFAWADSDRFDWHHLQSNSDQQYWGCTGSRNDHRRTIGNICIHENPYAGTRQCNTRSGWSIPTMWFYHHLLATCHQWSVWRKFSIKWSTYIFLSSRVFLKEFLCTSKQRAGWIYTK